MSDERMREALESRVEELVKIACVKEANDAIEARRGFNYTNCVRNAVRVTISEALSPPARRTSGYAGYEGEVNRDLVKKLVELPARRTSYEFVQGGDTLSVAWSIPNKSWALFILACNEWKLVGVNSGQSFTLATEIATLAGLEKEEGS